MSPSLTIKDIDAAAALTKVVSRDCDAVSNNAPPEFQLLLWSLSSLPHVLRILRYEAADPRSLLLKPEKQWMGIAVKMLVKLNLTLREIHARAKKYRNLGDSSDAERQKIWDKIENSTDSSSISTLRKELMQYDESIAQLILSLSMGTVDTTTKNQEIESISKTAKSLPELLTNVLPPTGPLPQIIVTAPGATDNNEHRTPIVVTLRQTILTPAPFSPKPVSESVTPVGGTSPAPNAGLKRSVCFDESRGSDGKDESLTSHLPPHSSQPSGELRKNDLGDEEMILESAIEVKNSGYSPSTMLNGPRPLADLDDSTSVETLPASRDAPALSAEFLLGVVAVEHPQTARRVVELLVARQPGLEITESLLKAVARNEESNELLMTTVLLMLLPSDHKIEISETLLEVAASNKKCGVKLVALLRLVRDRIPSTIEIPTNIAAPLTDFDSNFTSRSWDSDPSIASSQTSLQSVLPVVLRKAGDGIAKTLANCPQIIMIISEALKTQDSQGVDHRLFRALKEFSKSIRNLEMTRGLSKDELSILRNIRKKDTLDTISVQIRNITEAKASHSSHADALNSSNLLQQGELSNRTKVEQFLQCDDPEDPENTNNPLAELDESDDSHDSSDDDESAGVEFDRSIEQVLVFLKSDKVTELFQHSVMKRFQLVCRRLNLPNYVNRYEGTEYGQQTTSLPREPIVSPVIMTDQSHSWPIRFVRGKTDINFPFRSRWSLANEVKRWIEELVQEPINWWPLSPRRYPLPKERVWVTWKCRCGRRLSDIISTERMGQYHKWSGSCQTAPGQAETQGNTKTGNTPENPPPPPTAGPPKTRPNIQTPLPPTTNPQPARDLLTPQQTANHPVTTPIPQVGVIRTGTAGQDQLLMWCINLKSELTILKNLKVTSANTKKDTVTFQDLRDEYHRTRAWRMWFSLYTISRIKFVKFQLYRRDPQYDRVDCSSQEQLPSLQDKNYEYQPKPPGEIPPVSSRILMEYFEHPSCAGTSGDILEIFPKRTNGVITQLRGDDWGLHACEYLSFFRYCIMCCLVLMGPALFFVSWLVEHPNDLQNASVPAVLAMALIACFTGFPRYAAQGG